MLKIIGIGNKARQGKDCFAKYLSENVPNSVILHFADALYKECENEKSIEFPLVFRVRDGFMVRNFSKNYVYLNKCSDEKLNNAYESLNKIMTHASGTLISTYFHMEGKDAQMLQWWGTDFRRNLFGDDYWIKQLEQKIVHQYNTVFIIPDVRFYNEHNYIKNNDGIFVKVERYMQNGERFISNDRDSYHTSERALDNVKADYTIKCVDGDLQGLRIQAESLVKTLELTNFFKKIKAYF